jgi:beta-lactamase regulating signal transducer with metallopeptidase domain
MGLAAHWQVLAQIFADRMLNGVGEGILLAVFGWALLRMSGRQNSSTRFAVWFSVMVAIAALPFFGSMGFTETGPTHTSHSAFQLPGSYAADLFVVWALVASAGVAKIAFGFWQLRRLRRSCKLIDLPDLDPVLRNTLAEFGASRQVTICASERVRTPAAIGFFRPAIIFPPWILQELSPSELNAVLLHELAHLRRWDDWTNLAQEIIRALFFFHPVFWWIGRDLALEREMACDDFVLASNSNPRAYAQCLVSVAEKSFLRRGLALVQAAAGRTQQTTQRVMRILDAERPTATKVYKPALGLVAAFSAVCLVALPHAPRLVAFDGSASSLSASVARVRTPVLDSMGAAKMIPAGFRVSAPDPIYSGIPARAASRKPLGLKSRIYDRPLANLAAGRKGSLPVTRSPRMVNAKAIVSDSESDNDPTQAMLLVIQAQAVDSHGQVWSISIMRVTVFHPVDRQIQKEIIPKST